ncbi:hypothetical protein D8674_018137 [Pyrus ussuriensis x Pyrus communis]|uniref:Uncharacterized protein n=1 Tax=Pyrus ussuriensis x Pyrus communis TaxID=2448454 RepID=A0A5N5G3W7_9ROSA|nr:hypothetical protein D8674_018137 [Pyrus ussuriensis x Pyrus communis]
MNQYFEFVIVKSILLGSFIYSCMDRVAELPVSVPPHSELEGNESLFNTNYPAMVSVIIALIAYIGSLIYSRILHVSAHHNSDLAESFINKISLLLGTLSLILEMVILVPSLGLVAGFFWVVWFVKVVAEYVCEYLKTLYENAVASVIHTFGKLKDYLNMIIRRFATEPNEQNDELP